MLPSNFSKVKNGGTYSFSVLVGNNWGLVIFNKVWYCHPNPFTVQIEAKVDHLFWKVTLRKCLLGVSSSTCVHSPNLKWALSFAIEVKDVGEHH